MVGGGRVFGDPTRIRYVAQDGLTVITGDATGQIVTWDVRMSTCRRAVRMPPAWASPCDDGAFGTGPHPDDKVATMLNEPSRRPIAHLAVSAVLKGSIACARQTRRAPTPGCAVRLTHRHVKVGSAAPHRRRGAALHGGQLVRQR